MYLPAVKAKKIQCLLPILRSHVSYISIRFSLNNFYIHVMTSNGCTLFSVTGGTIKITSSKRNSTYNFELLLNMLAQKLIKLGRTHIMLCLGVSVLKRKKVILKLLQKHQLNVLGLSIQTAKAFNGVRLQKSRRL